jgi:hypothetical protein
MTTTAMARSASSGVTSPDEQWFRISALDMREGDYIRFRARNGRMVEGALKDQGDGTWWCNFETITTGLIATWARTSAPLLRRGLPALKQGARDLLDRIELLSSESIAALAVSYSTSASEAYDIMEEAGVNAAWWATWENVQGRMRHRARVLDPGLVRLSAPAADAVASAVLACAYESSLDKSQHDSLAAGWNKVMAPQRRA